MKMRKQMEALVRGMLDGNILLEEAIYEFEKLYIEECLERNENHITKSSLVLGIHRNTLSKRLSSYQPKHKKRMAKRR